ncbi:hypothetical protein D3C85_1465460 [compost metagenome]
MSAGITLSSFSADSKRASAAAMVCSGQKAISSLVGRGHQALHMMLRPPKNGTMPCCQPMLPGGWLAVRAERVQGKVSEKPPRVFW